MTAKATQGTGALHAQMQEEKIGLLRKVAPVHSGPLRRRTRFLKALHYFEIRSSVLLLYKSRSKRANPGFLESLFSKSGDADSIDSEIVQAASSRGQWDAAFDMSGAKVTALSADEKGGNSFPFRISFEGIFVLSVSVIDACDKDSPQRSLYLTAASAESRSEWLHHCTRAARSLSRGDFEPLKTVGKGQWGKVFLVRKTSGPVAGRAAADPGLVTGTDNVELLALKEVQLGSNTNINHVQNERLIMQAVPPHQFVVGMLYAFRTPRFLYYALDFMNGGDLFRHWRKHRNRRTEMAPFYASEVLLALEHLHKHCVIYRDLKPENVLLDSQGHIRLADLGLAKVLKSKVDRTSSFCGTEAYLAPEMILRLPYGSSVDFWQYGCFVYELYAGRSPFWLPRKPRKFIRENILNGVFAYPSVVPEAAKDITGALLQVTEARRLGCGKDFAAWDDVKKNGFFANTDWEALALKKTTPPVLPADPGKDMVNNFDDDFTNQAVFWGNDVDANGASPVFYEGELEGFSFIRNNFNEVEGNEDKQLA
ncbi:unnamed protein product [Ectocarpus sp. 4 AP-2014]